MLNSPTLCQYFVQFPFEIICEQFPQSLTYHYIDDILLADSNIDTLEEMFKEVKKILPYWRFANCTWKKYRGDFVNYLGYKIGLQKIEPQKV